MSYELRGVMKQGGQAQRVSPMTEIWKGMYDGGAVALKVLRLSQGDPDIKAAKHVSVLYNPNAGSSFVAVLTDGAAVLQRSCFDEAARTQQHSPVLRGVNDRLPLLSGVSLV